MNGPNDTSTEKYIYAQERQREIIATERLLIEGATHHREFFEPLLGWKGMWSWYAVRIPKSIILKDPVLEKNFPGDIDIMGGGLQIEQNLLEQEISKQKHSHPDADPSWWDFVASIVLMQNGQITWPPQLDFISAAEVKSSYLNAEGSMKASRQGRLHKFYDQAANLVSMGFNRVALLWLPVTEPVLAEGVEGFGHWREAAARAHLAADALEKLLTPQQRGFGQLIVSTGAVPGDIETMRGAITKRIVEEPPQIQPNNSGLSELIRHKIERFVRDVSEQYPVPRQVPVVIRACAPGGCGKTFISAPPTNTICPQCGRDTAHLS